MSQCLMEFLLQNAYIDTSVQKRGVPGVPGCLEHTGEVTQMIGEAREGRGDFELIRKLIMDYYSNFSGRVSSSSQTFAWHWPEKGIITGCTISVSLFSLATNMIVKTAEVKCRGPMSRSCTQQLPIRAFMDDLTVMTTFIPGCRWLLQELEQLISWASPDFWS